MKKMMKFFLPNASINGIDLCMAGIVVQIHHYLVFHIGQGHLNASRSVLYVEKSAVGQLIILNKSIITQKRSLLTVILTIRLDKVMSETYNVGLLNMKMLTIMQI